MRAIAFRAGMLVLVLTGSTFAQSPSNPTVMEFVSGGDIKLQVSAGGVEILPAKDNRITIRWTTKNPDDMGRVKIRSRLTDNNADIDVDGPRNFYPTIELPEKSNLIIRVSAGDVNVGEFKGDKDIRLRAGDLSIKMGDPDVYEDVDISVTTGGLDASRFDVSKGGLWRSFKHRGRGIYKLYAHVTAGQLTLD
jgi:hypothetical protein